MNNEVTTDFEKALIQKYDLALDVHTHTFFDYEALLTALEKRISRLLDINLEKLVNLMYQLDIDEKQFNACLDLPSIRRSRAIAELVLKREIEKMKSRGQVGKTDF